MGLPKTLYRDFGLLYENDKGEYVVLNDVRMADIRVPSLVNLLVYVSTYCEPIALLRQDKPFRILYLGHAQIITEHSFLHTPKNDQYQMADHLGKTDDKKTPAFLETLSTTTSSTKKGKLETVPRQ